MTSLATTGACKLHQRNPSLATLSTTQVRRHNIPSHQRTRSTLTHCYTAASGKAARQRVPEMTQMSNTKTQKHMIPVINMASRKNITIGRLPSLAAKTLHHSFRMVLSCSYTLSPLVIRSDQDATSTTRYQAVNRGVGDREAEAHNGVWP